MLPADPPGQLQGFMIPRAGHGAGIDHIGVRFLLKGDGGVAGADQQLAHGFGVILVDLAAESVKGDDHPVCYSISPYRASIAAAAAKPAVSVRRILGPSVIGRKTPRR